MPCRWVCTGVRMKYCNSFGASGLGPGCITHSALRDSAQNASQNPRDCGVVRACTADIRDTRVCVLFAPVCAGKREQTYDLRWISVNSFFRARFQRERQRIRKERKRRGAGEGEGEGDAATGCSTATSSFFLGFFFFFRLSLILSLLCCGNVALLPRSFVRATADFVAATGNETV